MRWRFQSGHILKLAHGAALRPLNLCANVTTKWLEFQVCNMWLQFFDRLDGYIPTGHPITNSNGNQHYLWPRQQRPRVLAVQEMILFTASNPQPSLA
jgi:hypothetical protein